MRSTLLFLFLFILGNQLKANSAFELSKKLNINLKPEPPVSGKIIDAKGNPIAGVNVTTKGRTVGTVTDINGNFEIVAEVGEILYISHIGFKTVEVKATTTPLSITLEEDATTLNTVSVLGSRGKPRTDVNRPVPIDIIMAEELQSTGQVELGVMIKYVAPSFNSNKYYNAVGSFTDPATLRGLWPDQVLVLVNGKRRHQFSAINPGSNVARGTIMSDMNTIPALALERVEVMRDGAAAQYGSDAIAGIINLGLKKSINKGTFKNQYGLTSEGDGQSLMSALNYGWSLGKEGSFLNMTLHYQKSEGSNRTGSYTGRIYAPATQSNTVEDSIRKVRGKFPTIASGNKVEVNRHGQNPIVAYQGFANIGYPLTKTLELYAFGGYSKRDITGNVNFIPAVPANPRSNPAVHPDGFTPNQQGVTQDYSGFVGIRSLKTSGWNMDLSTGYGQNYFDFLSHNSTNATLGANSPKDFFIGRYGFGQSTTDLNFSKNIENWAGTKSLNIAFGSQFRLERFTQTAGDSLGYIVGPVKNKVAGATPRPTIVPEDATNESRTNIGVYADIESDITDKFLVAAALRYEDYSDFGSNISGKIATRYKITEGVALRGSVNKGFRAPAAQQIYHTSTVPSVVGVNVLLRKLLKSSEPRLKQIGVNKPTAETSWNYNLGLTAKAGSKFIFTLDAYQIDIKDRIMLSENLPVSTIAALKPLFPGFEQVAFYTNAISTQTRGLDFVTTFKHDFTAKSAFNANLSVSLNKTQITDNKGAPTELQAGTTSKVLVIDTVSQALIETAQPRQRLMLSLNYKYGNFSLTLRGNHFGEVTAWEKPTSGAPHRSQTFGARTLFDAMLSYNINKNINLSVGSNNFTNVYPDRVLAPYDAYTLGSTPYSQSVQQFGFNGAFYYANLSINF